ncbi:MAG: IS1182 family transposase [Candidatus Aerophobetes bacterium]|nr:IS1182 family transposase [Candidatus Aerophobetes bacterium]
MLGKEDKQTSFFDTGFVCAHLINKNSFYAKMHNYADEVITDDDFADIYCLDNGRPSVPPARLTKVLILQNYENLSDREALEMVRFNIKWKYALDVPIDYEGFDRSLLVYFRSRLLINNKEKMVFKKTLKLAKKAGLLKKKVDQVIDSTPMLGASAVKDTYELLRDGIRKVLSFLDEKVKSRVKLSLKAYGKDDSKPKINWEDKKERQQLLSLLVSDVKEVLSHVDVNKEDIDTELKDAVNLLAKIVSQDIQEDKKGKPKIKKGVAKDRIISTTDPEMRHGRKSKSGKFNGYKNHILKDVDSDIITNIDVSPGNCPDKDMTESLIDEAKEEFGIETESLCGDGAYGSGKMRKKMDSKKIELISKAPPLKDTGKLNKEEFNIDVKQERVVCPEGKVAKIHHKSKGAEEEITKTFVFSKEDCSVCPRKDECTNAKNTGRTIIIGPYEEYLQEAREIQKTKRFKDIYNKIRPPVERKIAELISHGLRKTRYKGRRKSRLQSLFTAAAVNLKRIFKEQDKERLILDIVGANAVSI